MCFFIGSSGFPSDQPSCFGRIGSLLNTPTVSETHEHSKIDVRVAQKLFSKKILADPFFLTTVSSVEFADFFRFDQAISVSPRNAAIELTETERFRSERIVSDDVVCQTLRDDNGHAMIRGCSDVVARPGATPNKRRKKMRVSIRPKQTAPKTNASAGALFVSFSLAKKQLGETFLIFDF